MAVLWLLNRRLLAAAPAPARSCSKLTPDTYDGADAAMSGEEDEHDVLLRAAQGDSKFSTRVSAPSPFL